MTTLVKEKLLNKFPLGQPANGQNGNESVHAALLKQVSALDKPGYLELLESRELGLNESESEERLVKFGLNEVVHEKAPAWYVQLLVAFANPFIIVLLILATISFILDVVLAAPEDRDYKTVIVIGVMVALSTLIRFIQEFRSNAAAEKLKSLVKTTATVLRQETGRHEIEIKELVPGDIIFLSAGDMMPADMRILQSKDLFVSQSILTGEAIPVEKRELPVTDAQNKSVLELENICFMGTNVVSGTAIAIVVNTGQHTFFGSMAKSLWASVPKPVSIKV